MIAVLVGCIRCLIVFDIVALAVQPEGRSSGSAPSNLFTAGVASAFSIAGFMGFESAAIYSEEAKDPKRSIGRATFIAIAVISLFYAFSAWIPSRQGLARLSLNPRSSAPDLLFAPFRARMRYVSQRTSRRSCSSLKSLQHLLPSTP